MIKVIVFDLWNTLIPATIDFVRLKSLTKKGNSSLSEFIGRYERATQLKKYGSFEELRADFFNEFKGNEKFLGEEELYEIYFNRMDKINFFPDVEKNLVALKKEGYALALLSNTESVNAKAISKKLNLTKYFDYLFFSFDLGFVKPDKGAFLGALSKMGFGPQEALMVGDSLRSDINGSKNVGMHNCLINRSGNIFDVDKAKPDFEIKSLDGLFGVLKVLNSNNLNVKRVRK
jgi:putative hydrolase of the HAD superfamily